MTKMRKQHTSKAICLPLDAPPQLTGCFDALVAQNLASPMPASFIHDYTDETALVGNPYERRARDLEMKSCISMSDDLREGTFPCADREADHVTKITSLDDNNAEVRFAVKITPRPSLAAIEKACGAVLRPPEEETARLVKSAATNDWAIAPAP